MPLAKSIDVSSVQAESSTLIAAELDELHRSQQRLTRALRLLSACNQALAYSNEEPALLDAICRLIVDTGSYRMAWIGFPEQDAARTVRVVSRSGHDAGYLDGVRISWGDGDIGRGPTGTAIRLGATQINQDFRHNPHVAPWRESALARGYESSVALPLVHLNVVFGALTIYSSAPNAFGAEEVQLLEELARDLTFGLESSRSRQAHLEAERNLRLSEERQLERLSAHLQAAREEERALIARELHDELGQLLTALKMDVSWLRIQTASNEIVAKKLNGMTALLDTSLGAVRRISSDLRPTMLDDLGLNAAVEWLVEEFQKRHENLACTLVLDLGDRKIGKEPAIAAYRVVQECLTNVARHADADKLHLMLGVRDGRLVISIQDNGRGLSPDNKKDGFGLLGMRKRVQALGGSFNLESLPGEGVAVDVSLPLASETKEAAA